MAGLSFEFMLYAARQPQLTQRWNDYADKALVFIEEIMDAGKQSGEFRSDLDSAAASGYSGQFGMVLRCTLC